MPTNDHNQSQHAQPDRNVHTPEAPGYETTDVNVSGVAVFISGLVGFLLVFFVFCFVMGKVINNALEKSDGPPDKWHWAADAKTAKDRRNLASNPELQQKDMQQLTAAFPEPRVSTDDEMQLTTDLHAREDLMLEHYSSTPGVDGIRIPIERAMELV